MFFWNDHLSVVLGKLGGDGWFSPLESRRSDEMQLCDAWSLRFSWWARQ
jgi:hypothetical protein